MIYAFETYTLDTDRYELRRAGILCPLEPHALDILAYLLTHRDRVVTKQELLEHLWPQRWVSEGTLTQRLMMIRKALGDSGRRQHCIKTIHGRGYRFVATVVVHAPLRHEGDLAAPAAPGDPARHGEVSPAGVVVPEKATRPARSQTRMDRDRSGTGAVPRHPTPPLFRRPPHFVGREAELAQLSQWWATAQQGRRQVGLIVGEPGMGKTALIETFVAHVAATEELWVGRGQCVDHYGTGEPYLPVLEALGRLCRGAEGEQLVSCLRHYAPSWLAHLPALVAPAEREALVRTTHGVTPVRMLRELTDALEALTAARPLVLVLEDLHWSDRATLAWLAYMARRRDPAHVLILITYRPVELLGPAHPLGPLLAELRLLPQCAELVLGTLSPPAVAAYLTQRGAVTPLPASLIRRVHQRTSGHPLFLAALVDELARHQHLERTGDAGGSQEALAVLSESLPLSLRQYIEQHLAQLSAADQALLEAASVAGSTFAVAAVAAGVAHPSETLELRYTAFARQGQFLRARGTETWPDGTVTACYQFRHAVYHEVVYARVSAGHRVRLHQQIGARKEAGYGAQVRQIAAELAVHFARGQDARRAVRYLHYAGENALQRSAYQEAITHLRHGLEVLMTLPETPERTQAELTVLTTLGPALVATQGQAHIDVERTYVRARTLCHHLEDPSQLFLVLWGLLSWYVVRAELQAAWEVGEQLLRLARRQPDTTLLMVAYWALGQTSLFRGEFATARVHLDQGMALYSPQQHQALGVRAGFPGDLGVFCHCFAAHALWHLGYPDQARQRIHDALALAHALAHPFSRALALAYAAMLYQFRREGLQAHEAAEGAMRLCAEHGFAYYLAWGTIMQGWALTVQGQGKKGLRQMRGGLAALQATGAALRQPYYLALLADTCGQTGQAAAGLTMLADALTEAHTHGECWHEAELYRLQGEMLLQANSCGTQADVVPHAAGGHTRAAAAEQCFQQALAVARAQQGKSLELRAAMSLSRLWQQQGRRDEARALLAPLYGWFTEGFDTADLQEAKALLEELEG